MYINSVSILQGLHFNTFELTCPLPSPTDSFSSAFARSRLWAEMCIERGRQRLDSNFLLQPAIGHVYGSAW